MILLNDILRLPDIKNVKVRFNLNFGTKRPAIDYLQTKLKKANNICLTVNTGTMQEKQFL